jgi:hypothetical protein
VGAENDRLVRRNPTEFAIKPGELCGIDPSPVGIGTPDDFDSIKHQESVSPEGKGTVGLVKTEILLPTPTRVVG